MNVLEMKCLKSVVRVLQIDRVRNEALLYITHPFSPCVKIIKILSEPLNSPAPFLFQLFCAPSCIEELEKKAGESSVSESISMIRSCEKNG